MAEAYELIIKNEAEQQSTGDPVEDAVATLPDSSGGGTTAGGKSLSAFVFSQALSPILQAAVSYKRSHVNMYSGSQDLQDKWDFGFQILGNVGTVAGTALAGAAIAGPLGAIVGIAAGMVQVGIGYAQKAMEYDYNRSWATVNLGIQRERAGPSFNRSRLTGQ